MNRLRIYVDTSVIGGCLDEEFAAASRALLDKAGAGEAVLLVSPLLLDELARAPASVQEVLASVPPSVIKEVPRSQEAEDLHRLYLKEKVVGEKSAADALHVALASVARADVIASWNHRHIVHLQKIRGFHSVNIRFGYPLVEIRTPAEII